jgi:hypothetical protein
LAPDETPLPSSYHDVAPLGEGAFGLVYRAVDAEGRAVAVKVLASRLAGRPEVLWQFAGEYRRLARLAHPAFPRAYEEGRTPAGLPYYSMALVDGPEPAGPLPAARVRRVLAAIADALAYLHGIGLVHGDLKPENVRLEPDDRVTLLDVGLMAPVGTRREAIAGTLEYLAPEVLRKAPVAPAADLYALGVLGYALWTGRPPFTGSPADLVRAHLTRAPVPLEGDADLAALLVALLAKDPAARPPGAAAVAALLRGEPVPEAAAAGLRGAPLIGRQDVLSAWRAMLPADAGTRWLQLAGGSGLGKSRLLDELRLEAQLAGRGWVGAACGGLAEVPAGAARAVVAQALAAAGQVASPLVAAWLAGAVAEELRDLEPNARKVASFAAAARALGDAAEALGGLAVGLDDWHLADSASQAWVAQLRRAASGAPIAWVLAGEAAQDQAIELAPFTPEEARALVAARLGTEPPADLVALVLPAAAGNPLMLELLLEQLVADGHLAGGPGGWRFRTPATAGTALPEGAGAVWGARARQLPAAARRFAAVCAVALPAGELAPPLLAEAAGMRMQDLPEVLDRLFAEGVLTGQVRLAIAGLAPVFAAEVSAEERARWAGHLARGLIDPATPPDELPTDLLARAAALALAGDDDALAFQLAAAAGRRKLALTAPREALALLEAAAGRGGLPLDVALPKAEAERLLDQLGPAAADYEAALALAGGDAGAEALAAIGLGKCRQMQGDYAAALEAYGRAEARGDRAQQARALVSAARLWLYKGEAARAMAGCRQAAELAADAPAVRAQALTLEGYIIAHEDVTRAAEALERLDEAIAICTRLGDRIGLGMALDNLGNVHLAVGDLLAAGEVFGRYAANCRELGLETEAVGANTNQLVVASERGELTSAASLAASVERRAAAAGRKFSLAAAQAVHAQACWRAGRVQEALPLLDEALATAEAIGNKYLASHARGYRLEAWLGLGDLASARVEADAARELAATLGDTAAAARVEVLAGALARQAGELEPAAALLARGLGSPNRLVAHRAHQEAAELARVQGRLPEAQDHARAALAIAVAWQAPWHAAWDRVLLARALSAAGQRNEACAEAEQVLAERAGDPNPYARAGAALVLAELGERGRDDRVLVEARAALDAPLRALAPEAGRALLAAHGLERLHELSTTVAGVPSPAPGHATTLDPLVYGLCIDALAEAEGEAALAREALHQLMALCGAERGYLLAYEQGRLRQAVTLGMAFGREADGGFSHSIAEHVLFSGEPLYLADASADPTWREAASVMALELRTVVCLPLAVHHHLLGVVYMERAAIEPVLADQDLGWLANFARFAAAAIRRERARAQAALQAEHERMCARLGARLAAAAAPEDVRRSLLDAALALTGAERAFWLAPEAGGWRALEALGPQGRALAFAPGQVSQSILQHVAERREALGVLDLSTSEDWRSQRSVQALGLRTVWCLPAGARELVYLDTTRAAEGDPAGALEGLAALVAYAAALG